MAITISDDSKKSVTSGSIAPNAFKDQSIFPFIEFIFNRSPKEVMAITSPCFDKAKDKKFYDFIKDDNEVKFQITEPSFTLKERSLLS